MAPATAPPDDRSQQAGLKMNADAALAELIERLPGARVLCVGDVMLDRFVYGRVERISPEAPIPIFRVEREQSMLGGAGNVVRNLVSLGVQAQFVSVRASVVVSNNLRRQKVLETKNIMNAQYKVDMDMFLTGLMSVYS